MKATLFIFAVLCNFAEAEPTAIPTALKRLFPDAMGWEYMVVDNLDGRGPFIAKWDETALGKKPTAEQIAAAAAAAREEREAAAAAETAAKAIRETLLAKLEAGTITAAEQRALLKTLVQRVQKLEVVLKK